MGVIIMAKITSLQKKLEHRLPDVTFRRGDTFTWDHTSSCILYSPTHPSAAAFLLHEAGHASLGHSSYDSSVHLLTMERDAWQKAKEIGEELGITIDDSAIEDALDSYRDWLHARTTCPTCNATGIEKGKNRYLCLACSSTWTCNEARTCALKRYTNK